MVYQFLASREGGSQNEHKPELRLRMFQVGAVKPQSGVCSWPLLYRGNFICSVGLLENPGGNRATGKPGKPKTHVKGYCDSNYCNSTERDNE